MQVHANWCYKLWKRIRCTRKFHIPIFHQVSVPYAYEILRPPRHIRPGVRGEAVDPGQHGGHPGQQHGHSSLNSSESSSAPIFNVVLALYSQKYIHFCHEQFAASGSVEAVYWVDKCHLCLTCRCLTGCPARAGSPSCARGGSARRSSWSRCVTMCHGGSRCVTVTVQLCH